MRDLGKLNYEMRMLLVKVEQTDRLNIEEEEFVRKKQRLERKLDDFGKAMRQRIKGNEEEQMMTDAKKQEEEMMTDARKQEEEAESFEDKVRKFRTAMKKWEEEFDEKMRSPQLYTELKYDG